jgi:transposase
VNLLESQGHRPVLSHPKQTRAIAAARPKNDRVDAERLLLLLRGDLLPRGWIPPRDLREAREPLRHRVSLVWVRTGIKNRLLALLTRRNVRPTRSKGWWTDRGRQDLQPLLLSPIPSTIREDCLASLHLLDEQIRRLDQELIQHWGEDPRVCRSMTTPGIGPFTAILLVLELGNVHRFPSAKHLASYVGLTPRVRASANRIRLGHIGKEGNRLVRWALVGAATQAARQPGPLRAWLRTVQQRKGKKMARVALARRLAEIAYHV